MKSYLPLPDRPGPELPAEFAGDDVRYPAHFVAGFLERYTRPGEVVLDPFAGYGTTLVAAEAMGRVAYGLELDEARWRYGRSLLDHPERLIQGDARHLADYGLPPFDFSITSPPYMQRGDREDPLDAYASPGASYETYLAGLKDIYRQMAGLMKPAGRAVVEVANLKNERGVTTLAWDVAGALGEVLAFQGETVLCWERYGYGYEHSYALLFGRRQDEG